MLLETKIKLTTFSHAWRALKHRNFKLFFAGQSISVIGTWMTRMATSWLVYRMTHSALLLGLVSFSSQIVPFLLQPLAGAWVERLDRHKLLVWTQVAACLQSLALAFLTLSGVITIWEVIALSSLQGFINAFDTPARQSFLIQMVEDRGDLSNAIAINSTMTNSARLFGPALAGLVIGAVGEGWCFLIDGVSYLAVIASLLCMHIKPITVLLHKKTLREQMREGWTYVRTFRPIRSILLLFGFTALMGYPYIVLLPVFAGEIFHGGPHTLGWLTGASGCGALLSALTLTLRKSVVGLVGMIQLSCVLLGGSLILFGLSHTFWWSLILLGISGFGLMQTAAACNTIIQTVVSDDKRSRVMSYYAMAFYGSAPIGSLLAGILAQKIGAPHTILVTGMFCVLGSIWFAYEVPKLKKAMNPIYQEMGIK
jgi:MFS family permease